MGPYLTNMAAFLVAILSITVYVIVTIIVSGKQAALDIYNPDGTIDVAKLAGNDDNFAALSYSVRTAAYVNIISLLLMGLSEIILCVVLLKILMPNCDRQSPAT